LAVAPAEGAKQSIHLFPVLKMLRRAFRNIANALAGLAAATLLVEAMFWIVLATPLRWVLPVPPVALYGPDPDTGYRHRANVSGLWLTENRAFITTSKLGLRDRDRGLARGVAPRAVVIGDSFIEALQVDWSETAVAVAERILARDGSAIEVVNLGLAGARAPVEVARLQSQGLAMQPDLAVIVVRLDQLVGAIDDGEYTGYRRGADGQYHLSYGFRASRGYRFRTSAAGRVFYWLLDHSQVVRIINARKNAGLLAEWPQPAPTRNAGSSAACPPAALDALTAAWVETTAPEGRAVSDAFIRDLARLGRSNRMPIVVASFGIEARCPALDAKRLALIDAIRARLDAAGLRYVDLDGRMLDKVGADRVMKLHGFGPNVGGGHLNVEGNKVLGEILAKVIAAELPRP
jgi:hypothetical protein